MSNPSFSIPGLMEIQTPISDALPQFLHLSPHRASNTLWSGIASIGPVTVNGTSMPYPAVNAWLEFFDRSTPDAPVCVLSNIADLDGDITIVEPASAWAFVVPEQPLPVAPGMWDWRFRVEDSAGSVTTIYDGDILIK